MRRHRFIPPAICLLLTFPCVLCAQDFAVCRRNAAQAQGALQRSNRVLHAYLKRIDPVTGLLPRRGGDNTWYVRDSAADLYPFLIMAAYYTDRAAYENEMQAILRNELLHSTRVGRLSDNVLPGGQGFEAKGVNLDNIMFGSCEYIKDGLLPLTELLGHHGWYARMIGMADDVIANAPYETPHGRVPSLSAEINGEFLQALSRLAFETHDPRYVGQGLAITRFYFEEVIPKSNGLPAHLWDLQTGQPASDRFVLSDHGNEIVAGLSEFVTYLKETKHTDYEKYSAALAALVNVLLDVGLNDDGVWVSALSVRDRSVLDARHAHCWGYLFNGVYTAYLITGEQRFLDATKRTMKAVADKPTYLDDPDGSGRKYGSNAYSDAIESAIVFLNRMPDDAQFAVLDTCVARFLARQREDGIIEDWYGDGNYVRTALMYALMKSQGTWIEPWRADVRLGAVRTGDAMFVAIDSDSPWEGKLRFDIRRHKAYFNLPVNYTRLNEWPEWFTVELDRLYTVQRGAETFIRSGAELAQGLPVSVSAGQPAEIHIAALPGPPYGK
ncbi:MAG: hypothetical protein HUU46_22040 [Candidatus Hydrogenedentes bacterium]|nr:hypothetical protein [Candidatus Hydrogenedentota bacterium]